MNNKLQHYANVMSVGQGLINRKIKVNGVVKTITDINQGGLPFVEHLRKLGKLSVILDKSEQHILPIMFWNKDFKFKSLKTNGNLYEAN